MKRMLLFSVLSLVVFGCTAPVKGKNGVTYTTAVQYNDYIVAKQKEVYESIEKIATAFEGGDFANAEAIIAASAPVIAQALQQVEGMPEWRGKTELRDKAVGLFKYYDGTMLKEFGRIAQIGKMGDSKTQAEIDELSEVETRVGAAEEKLDKQLQAAQAAFAKENGIKLEKSASN